MFHVKNCLGSMCVIYKYFFYIVVVQNVCLDVYERHPSYSVAVLPISESCLLPLFKSIIEKTDNSQEAFTIQYQARLTYLSCRNYTWYLQICSHVWHHQTCFVETQNQLWTKGFLWSTLAMAKSLWCKQN